MKVAILTWLHNQNFGTLLQAYALQKFIMDNGYEVEDIDYLPSNREKIKNWILSRNSPALFIGKFKEYINRKKEQTHSTESSGVKFEKFLSKYIASTQRCSTTSDLKKLVRNYDIFICGSDQIWSPYLFNPNFYFSFLDSSAKHVIAYGPSFGVTDASKRKKKIIARELKKFSAISVREDTGKKFVEKLGYYDVQQVIDPVMLLGQSEWNLLIAAARVEQPAAIVCYFLGDNPSYWKAAECLASKLNCPIITLVGSGKRIVEERYSPIYALGPDEWLAYIAKAKFVLTDSLHGTLFSLLFKKHYYCFKRFKEGERRSQNSRVESLARLTKMEDRLIESWDESKINNINIEEYDEKLSDLERLIDKSKKWLITALEC